MWYSLLSIYLEGVISRAKLIQKGIRKTEVGLERHSNMRNL